MIRPCSAVVLTLACAGSALAAGPTDGSGRYWVFLMDKGPGADARVADLLETYNQRAVHRRMLRRTDPGLFDARDLPVWPEYVDAIGAAGADVVVQSKWLNAVSVRATDAQLDRIADLAFVSRTEPVRAGAKSLPVDAGPADGGTTTRGYYGMAEEQIAQMDLINVHGQGYTAQDVIIGILDTGFEYTHDAFNSADKPLTVIAQWDFINEDDDVGYQPGDDGGQHSHGTLILGTLAAYMPNTYVGTAVDASFILCKTEDITSETPVEEDYFVAGLEFIEANGGDLATASLGYIDWYSQADLDGQTAVTTIGVNVATANGLFCLSAAGNEGHDDNASRSHLIAPTDAFDLISCGAVESTGEITGFSSDGPTADGRVKPELLARGSGTYTVDPYSNDGWWTASGTSLSTPLVAGAVACLIGAKPAWTIQQMRQSLFDTGTYYVDNGTFDPLFIHGYGIIQAGAALATADCPPDFNGDGILNSQDFIDFLNAFTAGDASADYSGDGAVNSQDFIAFLNDFVAGC